MSFPFLLHNYSLHKNFQYQRNKELYDWKVNPTKLNHSVISITRNICWPQTLRQKHARLKEPVQMRQKKWNATLLINTVQNRIKYTYLLHDVFNWVTRVAILEWKNCGGTAGPRKKVGASINVSPAWWLSVVMKIDLLWLTLSNPT